MKDTDLKFFSDMTAKKEAPYTVREFFQESVFAKAANSPMETSAKNQGWSLPDIKSPQPMGLPDMKAPSLKDAKPNMLTQAMSNTQKPVQQQPNNPTGVSSGQGFNPV